MYIGSGYRQREGETLINLSGNLYLFDKLTLLDGRLSHFSRKANQMWLNNDLMKWENSQRAI